jgi:predicted site-specific integrase-resolvase
MPLVINEKQYFRPAETQRIVGISKNTLINWLKGGILGQYELRDRNGWRLFTQDDIETLKKKATQIKIVKCSR